GQRHVSVRPFVESRCCGHREASGHAARSLVLLLRWRLTPVWSLRGLPPAGEGRAVKWTVVGEGPGSSRVLLGQFDRGAELLTPIYVPSFSSFGDPDFLVRSLAVLRSVEKVQPRSAR